MVHIHVHVVSVNALDSWRFSCIFRGFSKTSRTHCPKKFLWAHKEVELAQHPIIGLLHRTNDRFPTVRVLQMQKLRTHLLKTQSSKFLLLKPGERQNIALCPLLQFVHSHGAFFPANLYPPGPSTFIFSKTSPEFFLC